MKIIDMHCDTISELADRGGELWKNSGHLDLKRISVAEFRPVCRYRKVHTDTLGAGVCSI